MEASRKRGVQRFPCVAAQCRFIELSWINARNDANCGAEELLASPMPASANQEVSSGLFAGAQAYALDQAKAAASTFWRRYAPYGSTAMIGLRSCHPQLFHALGNGHSSDRAINPTGVWSIMRCADWRHKVLCRCPRVARDVALQ